MKRSSLFLLLPILLLTACQPATGTPTPLPTLAITPTMEAEPQGYQPSWRHVVINEIIIEEGECCISAPVGESLTLHIDLSSFEMQKTPAEMRLASSYNPFRSHDDGANVWVANWQAFNASTELTFEVLPNWNEIEICVLVTRVASQDVDHKCNTIAVYGESPETGSTMAQLDPKKLEAGMQLELPGWLGDPQYHVFAVVWAQLDDRFVIAFFNAETQERFDLLVAETTAYFWTPDGQHFGLLEQFGKRVHLIDLQDGSVQTYPIGLHSIKPLLNSDNNFFRFRSFPDPVPGPLVANSADPASEDFQLAFSEEYWQMPYEIRFEIWDEQNTYAWVVVVENRQTGEEYWLTDPEDGNEILDADFSSANGHIVVAQGIYADSMIQPGDHLLIYSAATGEKLAEYEFPAYRAEWSPDGQEILFSTRYHQDLAFPQNAPCILTVATTEVRCITEIPRHFETRDFLIVGRYRWSADGARIYFTYEGSEPDDIYGHFIGNYCYYQFEDGGVQCPDEDQFIDELQAGHFFTLNADEQYIAVEHGGCSSWGDDGCSSQISVFGIENDDYLYLGYEEKIEVELYDDWEAPSTSFVLTHSTLLWRPAIQP